MCFFVSVTLGYERTWDIKMMDNEEKQEAN